MESNTVALVFVSTSLAVAAGAIETFVCSNVLTKTYDLPMVLNGILSVLVGAMASVDLIGTGRKFLEKALQSIYRKANSGKLTRTAMSF